MIHVGGRAIQQENQASRSSYGNKERSQELSWVRIYQPFSRTFFIPFPPRLYYFESNELLIGYIVWFSQLEFALLFRCFQISKKKSKSETVLKNGR